MSLLYSFPSFTEKVLNNGVRLLLIPDDEQDGLVIMHQFPFGRFADPMSQEGLTELTVSLMQKGTKSLNFEQLSEKFEHRGAMIFSDMGEEQTVLGVKMLSSFQDELVPVFLDMIVDPSLSPDEFKRIQREMITGLKAEQIEPGVIAHRHFYVEVAGKQHPAGRFHSEKSVKNIRLADITQFYKNNVIPQDSIIAIAGKFKVDEFISKFQSRIEQWNSSNKKIMNPAESVVCTTPGYRLIDKPDLTQATLVLGHAAPGESDNERNAIALANYILGGGNFSSRLMTRIRSKSGKTYGINSQTATQRFFGTFTISTSTQNSQLAEVMHGIIETLKEFNEKGVTPEELDNARKFAIGNMAFQLEGIGNVAEKLLWLRLFNRPESYVEKFDELLNTITVETVNDVIKRVIHPDKMKYIIVGNKKELLPQLKDFGTFTMYHFRDNV